MLVHKYVGNEMHELDFCRDDLVIELKEAEIKEVVESFINLSDEFEEQTEALYDEINKLRMSMDAQTQAIEKAVSEIDDIQLLREELLKITEKI